MSTRPEIPLDIQNLLKSCILNIFWPKSEIIDFFRSVGCPSDILDGPEKTQNVLKRHAIVNSIFGMLNSERDRGYQVFQEMSDVLRNWSHFNPYWFHTTERLNINAAQDSITRLNNAIQKRNNATKRQQTQRTKFHNSSIADHNLTALKKAFEEIYGTKLTPQARGKLFEDFLRKLFNQNNVKMGEPFSIKGEQIDGTFKFEGENYIVEAKWQDPSTSTGDLYKFALKVDGKMHGRGIFISANGFSRDGIEAIVRGKHIKTILIDGQDLIQVLEKRISLSTLLDTKIRAAQVRGDVHICAITGRTKI